MTEFVVTVWTFRFLKNRELFLLDWDDPYLLVISSKCVCFYDMTPSKDMVIKITILRIKAQKPGKSGG
jgi:hypothetical protein